MFGAKSKFQSEAMVFLHLGIERANYAIKGRQRHDFRQAGAAVHRQPKGQGNGHGALPDLCSNQRESHFGADSQP